MGLKKKLFMLLVSTCCLFLISACIFITHSIRTWGVAKDAVTQLSRGIKQSSSASSEKVLQTRSNGTKDIDQSGRTVRNFIDLGLSMDQQRQLKHGLSIRKDHYPKNGTGVTVDISKDFNPSVFNNFCKTFVPPLAVLPIYSKTGRFESRHQLRQSLGKWAKQLDSKIFFIVGVSLNKTENELLRREYYRERDILMVGKIDSYRDLNNKAFAMVEWISKHCTNVPYIIHLIDDVYIDLMWFIEQLESIKDEFYILAPVASSKTVRKHPKSSVTVEEYPFRNFPPYAYGWSYAFPSRVAALLLSAVHKAYYCWIEDVWLGGHVRISAGVKLIAVPRNKWKDLFNKFKIPNATVPDIYVFHGVDDKPLFNFYLRSLTIAED